MLTKIGMAAAVALVTFLAIPGTSIAQQPTKATAPNCLGGGCVGENPDRAQRPERMSSYKRSKKAKTTQSCLGGACVGENPDRAERPVRMNSYKRTHKKHHTPTS
jgi:hypothetical protein